MLSRNFNHPLLIGFLLICCIHWGGVVLTIFMEHLAAWFLEYDQLPWLRLAVLPLELYMMIRLLGNSRSFDFNRKQLIKLAGISVVLFFAWQFREHLQYHPFFCGNALIDDWYDDMMERRDIALISVLSIETVFWCAVIVIFLRKIIKKGDHSETE